MWGYGHDWGMMGYGGWGGWDGYGVLHMIVWLLFLGLIVAGIVWFVRNTTQHGTVPQLFARRPAALDALEERYARGEIGRDEYLQKRRDILGE